MSRVFLRIYRDPDEVETIVNLKKRDGGYYTYAGNLDTGAETSLLSAELMNILEYRVSERGQVWITQAGIARQEFQSIEAYITLFLEDFSGNRTQEFEAKVWFAHTRRLLIGFDGILNRAIFHLDMPNLSGYLEFPD